VQCVLFNEYALYFLLTSSFVTPLTLEKTYVGAELAQLHLRRSDSELACRYSMKKCTLTVDPIMLEMNCE